MNAAFLLMSLAPGADVTTAGWGESPPLVVQAGGCCGAPAAAGCCDSCGSSKVGLLDKIKGRMGGLGGGLCKKKHADCGCAPTCAPAPVCAPAPCAPACNSCGGGYSQPNLLDRLRGKFAGKKGSCCAPACNTCGSAPVAGCATPLPPGAAPVNPGTTVPPKEMPKPKDTTPPKGTGLSAPPAPAPGGITLPPVPISPISGPKISTGSSPY